MSAPENGASSTTAPNRPCRSDPLQSCLCRGQWICRREMEALIKRHRKHGGGGRVFDCADCMDLAVTPGMPWPAAEATP